MDYFFIARIPSTLSKHILKNFLKNIFIDVQDTHQSRGYSLLIDLRWNNKTVSISFPLLYFKVKFQLKYRLCNKRMKSPKLLIALQRRLSGIHLSGIFSSCIQLLLRSFSTFCDFYKRCLLVLVFHSIYENRFALKK